MQNQHKHHKTKAILLSTLIFVCGGITGGVVQYTFTPATNIRPPHRHGFNRKNVKDFAKSLAKRIGQKYEMAQDDIPKVEKILRTGGKEIGQLGEEMRPRVTTIYEGINKQIRELIPPQKLEAFDTEVERRRNRLPPIFFHRPETSKDSGDTKPPAPPKPPEPGNASDGTQTPPPAPPANP